MEFLYKIIMKKIFVLFAFNFIFSFTFAQFPLNFGITNNGWDYSYRPPVAGVCNSPSNSSGSWTTPNYTKAGEWALTSNALPIGYLSPGPGGVYGGISINAPLNFVAAANPTTLYIRKTITLPLAIPRSAYTTFTLKIKADDGVRIYFNGSEVANHNLPTGAINAGTSAICKGVDITDYTFTIPNTFPIHPSDPDKITITAEIHQCTPTATTTTFGSDACLVGSSDLFFDCELTGTLGSLTPSITRGPYLQLAVDNAVDLVGTLRDPATTKQFRWATNTTLKGAVKYWIDVSGSTVSQVSEVSTALDHTVNIGGLTANKKYRYEIGYIDPVSLGFISLITSPDHFFMSGPQFFDLFTKKTKVWVTGDIGFKQSGYFGSSYAPSTGPPDPAPAVYNTVQSNVINGFNTWASTNVNPSLDFWLLLGDNAYLNGSSKDYQDDFFTPLQNTKMMKQATLIPALGNHDYYESRLNSSDVPLPTRSGYTIDGSGNDRLSRNYAYYDLFKTPQKGQAGGVPSGSPSYYSFDANLIHFIVLDSYGADLDPITGTRRSLWENNSPQLAWLENDLIQNDIKVTNAEIYWTVVILHHPPYTKGSYDSDKNHGEAGVSFNDGIMNAIANKLVRKLENHKVDLVLSGHSHVYERSKQLKGLYDPVNPNIGPISSALTSAVSSSSTYKPNVSFNAVVNQINSSSGKYDGSPDSCPFETNSTSLSSTNGIVYAVVGSASTVQITPKDPLGHKALPIFNYSLGGSMLLEMQVTKLVAKWIDQNGNVGDSFTMLKDIMKRPEVVYNISALDGPPYSPSFQRLTDPSGITGIPFTFSPPPAVLGSSHTFIAASGTYNITNPQIGPYYTFSDASGCLVQNIRFHFAPDCWPNTGTITSPSVLTINNYIDSPVDELIRSNGIIEAFNTISPTSTVEYQSVRNVKLSYIPPSIPFTPSPFKFFAQTPTPTLPRPHPTFSANIISTCP